jgi:tetratricopeptide (TPR) repeat protein
LRYDESLESCNKAIGNRFEDYRIYENKGLALENKGELRESLIAFKKSLELNPDNNTVQESMSRVSSKNNFRKARIIICILLIILAITVAVFIIRAKKRVKPPKMENIYRGINF